MATRRSHQKSRHGCSTCKRRKVKCDEQRPTCNNCSQRQDTCVYSAPVPFFFAGQSGRSSSKESHTKISSTEGHSSDGSTRAADHGISCPEVTRGSSSLNMEQLELQLHWIMHTHKLFARNEETRKVWEILVLQEALRAPFLMHGILALSALHLSHLHQDGRQTAWLDIAIAHKSTALSMFSDQLHNISESNAKAMVSFASLAVAFSFASALNCHDPADGPSLRALIDVFTLARGVQTVVNGATEFLRQSNYAPLFNITVPEVNIPDHVLAAFDRLDNLNNQCSQQSSTHNKTPYERAITNLRELVVFTYAEPNSLTMAAGWAIRAPVDYLSGLKNYEPLALVVLAHYCAFLHLARENWCAGTWGRSVLEEIVQTLDPNWQCHIDWAIKQVTE